MKARTAAGPPTVRNRLSFARLSLWVIAVSIRSRTLIVTEPSARTRAASGW